MDWKSSLRQRKFLSWVAINIRMISLSKTNQMFQVTLISKDRCAKFNLKNKQTKNEILANLYGTSIKSKRLKIKTI